MSIKVSDSIRVGQQKPLEDRYANELVPYISINQVNNLVPKSERHIGLTVNINKEEYWYKDGIEDSNLVLKITNSSTNDLKNQEQDDRLENLEGENANQNDLINDLSSELDFERTRNDVQDSMLGNLEGGLAAKLDKGAYTGDASNLVPYTGANKDVNIASNYFETSQGFKKTGGTSSQYLMADGSTSTLPTDLIRGTGTIGRIARYSATGVIGNSVIYDDGANVGVGTGVPSQKLTVLGADNTIPALGSNGGKLGLLNGVSGVGTYGLIQGVLGSGSSYLQVQRVDGTPVAYNLLIQPNGGNVGIGEILPIEKLEVNGYVKATGFKTPTGAATQALTANGGTFNLNTKADLENGKIPATQLPSYVDDVLEYVTLASFPATGENGKIYIAIDTNLTYRWGGSSYVVMSSSLALGETPSTAYRGDRGKIAYDHSQTIGNPHGTKLEELNDVSGTDTTIADTDEILKKESGGLWKKITFANFKGWFTTELAKKINIGLDTVFNFKNISAMTLTEFRSITPNIETIYFTEEQNGTGWQQVRYNGLGITIPASTETLVSLTNENFIELDSDSTFNLIDVANTKINGIFEKDFVIIKFNAGVVTPATANQWFKVILKVNNVQTAVSPVFYLTETSGTVEQIAHNFALNVPTEMVTNGATLHLKTSTSMTFNNPAISVARVHKSTNANL